MCRPATTAGSSVTNRMSRCTSSAAKATQRLPTNYSPRSTAVLTTCGRRRRVTELLQLVADLGEDRWVVDRGRCRVLLTVGDAAHRAAEDLAGARLRRPRDHGRLLEGGDGTDPLANE